MTLILAQDKEDYKRMGTMIKKYPDLFFLYFCAQNKKNAD